MLENFDYCAMKRHPSFEDLETSLFPNRKKKVMVIDDDQDFRLSVCELLVDEGFSVMTAKDGEAGLNHLVHQAELPDIILVDLMMPIKNGIEFRREQLQLDELRRIPVVFLTGQGYVEGESCILKPFDEQELISVVNRKLSAAK
jgi:CheY-like chemotaxis protein